MRFVFLSLLLCGVLATGLTVPVENEQLPPIGGYSNPINPIILESAKTLIKVQESLRSAGRIGEAIHLNKLIEKTEKLLKKGQSGDIESDEVFDLKDHLYVISKVLEKYKNYLPIQNTIALIVPKNEELVQHVRAQIDELIEQLKERREYAKVKWMNFCKILLDVLDYKKENFGQGLEFVLREVKETMEQMKNRVKGHLNLNNLVANTDGGMVRDLLDGIVKDLEKIEIGLKEDGKWLESGKVGLYKNIIRSIKDNTDSENGDRFAAEQALKKGMELVKKYANYLKDKTVGGLDFLSSDESSDRDTDLDREDAPIDEDDLFDDDENLPDEKEKEENQSLLQKLRVRLVELRDRLRNSHRVIRSHIVGRYIDLVDALLKRLQNDRLSHTRLNEFLNRIKQLLEKLDNKF